MQRQQHLHMNHNHKVNETEQEEHRSELIENYTSTVNVSSSVAFSQLQPVSNQFVNSLFYPTWIGQNDVGHTRNFAHRVCPKLERIQKLQTEIGKQDGSIRYLRAKVKKQHKENEAMRFLLNNIVNQKKLDVYRLALT